jgi:homoserine O-acetyltransferase
LGILERDIKRVPPVARLSFRSSNKTRGHGSHTIAALWKDELMKLLSESQK